MNPVIKKFQATAKARELGRELLAEINRSQPDIDACRKLIDAGADLEQRDRGQGTPLVRVISHTMPELVQPLIDADAKLDARAQDGLTALMWTVHRDMTDTMKQLLNAGASVDEKDDDGWTALFYAIANGKTEMTRLLLDRGASIDIADKSEQTPEMLVKHIPDHNPARAVITSMLADKREELREAAREKQRLRDGLQSIDRLAHTGDGERRQTAVIRLLPKKPFAPGRQGGGT